jgi:hypothetical protein
MSNSDPKERFINKPRKFLVEMDDPDNLLEHSELVVVISALTAGSYDLRLSVGDASKTVKGRLGSNALTTFEPIGSRHVDVRPIERMLWGLCNIINRATGQGDVLPLIAGQTTCF